MLPSQRLEVLARRVIGFLTRLDKRVNTRSKRMDRILLLLAILVFVGGFVLAFVNLPESNRRPVWTLLALVAVIGVPLTIATNAAEYGLSANLLGYRVSVESALRVSLVAAAANLLPIPGSVLVRTEAVRRLGAKTGKALATSTVVGIAWLATTAALTGGLLLFHGRATVGAIATAIGAILLGITLLLCFRLDASRALAIGGRLLVVESASVLVKAARLFVIFHALHYQVGVDQAMALTSAAVVSTATGFFPGGMGATEVLSAAVSPLVDLPAALGLLGAAIDRIIGLVGLAILSGLLLIRLPRIAEDMKEMKDASETVRSQSESPS
jgi:hypothetical protein